MEFHTYWEKEINFAYANADHKLCDASQQSQVNLAPAQGSGPVLQRLHFSTLVQNSLIFKLIQDFIDKPQRGLSIHLVSRRLGHHADIPSNSTITTLIAWPKATFSYGNRLNISLISTEGIKSSGAQLPVRE
jgi:hypothetical protein